MRYPDFIKPKDTLGFIAPSFGCNIEPYRSSLLHALDRFKELSYETKLGPNCFLGEGVGISNTPQNCAKEFMSFWCESDCKALLSCGGGELMCEILPYLDFEKIKAATPKWFLGYSDNTNIGFLLATLADTASIYCPCATGFGMEPWHESIHDLYALMIGKKLTMESYDGWQKESIKTEDNPLAPYNITEQPSLRLVNYEKPIKGRLLGGCMDIIDNIKGTRFDRVREFCERYKEDGIIWFLEACDKNMLDIRRSLWSMEQAGYFQYAKGFLIGRPLYYDNNDFSVDRYEAVTAVLEKYGLPMVMDLDFGHLPPSMPLISGALATVSTVGKKVQVKMTLA